MLVALPAQTHVRSCSRELSLASIADVDMPVSGLSSLLFALRRVFIDPLLFGDASRLIPDSELVLPDLFGVVGCVCTVLVAVWELIVEHRYLEATGNTVFEATPLIS